MCSPVVKSVKPGQWLSKRNRANKETDRYTHHGDLKGLHVPFVTESTITMQVICFPAVK